MIIRSKWILDSNGTLLENAVLDIENGRVIQVRKAKCYEKSYDLGDGVVTLGLINCHNHLWLSHVNYDPSSYNNFLDWTKFIIRYVDEYEKDRVLSALETGIAQSKAFGTYCILDIQPLWMLELCCEFKLDIKLVRYVEILGKGLDEIDKALILNHTDGICFHGPHTVAPDTMRKILLGFPNKNPPITIHIAESEYEIEFLRTGKGPWKELLIERGFDISRFAPFGRSPCERLLDLGILGPETILVHCLHLTQKEIQILKQKGSFICICPRSNLNLHKRLPPLDELLRYGINLCLGTDSLASVIDLSLWEDMKCLLEHFPQIEPKSIFQMATEGGAQAVGLGHYSIEGAVIKSLIYMESELDVKDPYGSLIYSFDPKGMKWIGELNGL